jgi:SH3 domain protein
MTFSRASLRSDFLVQLLLLCAMTGGLWTAPVHAEERWVTDEFEVMMRREPGARKAIVRQLKSGTQVEVLETNQAEGYSKVRLPSGAEGWVLTRYLRRGPTAKLRLPQLEEQLADSEAKRRELQQQVNELSRARDGLQSEIGALQSNNSSVQSELDRITGLSSASIQLDDENRRLKQRLSEIDKEIESLQRDNERLSDRSAREWFLIGAVVLATGLILGLIIPRIRWRKKSSWSDF